jgi:hypothetical protein
MEVLALMQNLQDATAAICEVNMVGYLLLRHAYAAVLAVATVSKVVPGLSPTAQSFPTAQSRGFACMQCAFSCSWVKHQLHMSQCAECYGGGHYPQVRLSLVMLNTGQWLMQVKEELVEGLEAGGLWESFPRVRKHDALESDISVNTSEPHRIQDALKFHIPMEAFEPRPLGH